VIFLGAEVWGVAAGRESVVLEARGS